MKRPGLYFLFCSLLLLGPGCTSFHGKRVEFRLRPAYGVEDPQFLRSVGNLVGSGMLASNRVATLVNGDQIFPAMLEAIRSAEKTICVETYIYWSGDVGHRFSDALMERSAAGIKVHVLLDWVGSRKMDKRLIKEMQSAGIELEHYNPPGPNLLRLNHRDHRKIMLVDGKIGFTGGAGLADLWAGKADSPEHWRDTHYKVEGPAVAHMQAAFAENWIRMTGRVLEGENYFPEHPPAGTDLAQMFRSSPREGSESVRLMYLFSFACAQKTIQLAVPYFIPGKLTTQEMVEARRRGVAVDIIVPGALTDSPSVRHASRSKWGPLLRAGVKIHEYQPTMYHWKATIVDGVWASVGSANFDNRSFRLNDEANLNVFSPAFARAQAALFRADLERCHQVSYEEWKRRSVWKRFLELLTTPFHSNL